MPAHGTGASLIRRNPARSRQQQRPCSLGSALGSGSATAARACDGLGERRQRAHQAALAPAGHDAGALHLEAVQRFLHSLLGQPRLKGGQEVLDRGGARGLLVVWCWVFRGRSVRTPSLGEVPGRAGGASARADPPPPTSAAADSAGSLSPRSSACGSLGSRCRTTATSRAPLPGWQQASEACSRPSGPGATLPDSSNPWSDQQQRSSARPALGALPRRRRWLWNTQMGVERRPAWLALGSASPAPLAADTLPWSGILITTAARAAQAPL
jgi:hypothetical protein